LKPLAADMIELLEKSQQWVDPNLLQLKEENSRGKGGKRPRKDKPSVSPSPNGPSKALSKDTGTTKNDDDDDDPFPGLTASRIVLKRSKHVAESSDDGSDGDDD
jgi:hypothetical protein